MPWLFFFNIGKLALYTAPAANVRSRRKGSDSWTKKDTTSCQSPGTLWKRILPTVLDMDHLCGSTCTTKHMICWRKPQAQKCWLQNHSGKMARWWQIPQVFVRYWVGWGTDHSTWWIALEDHSYVATWQERSRNGKSWNISLNAAGIQGPLNQRSDFIEAIQKCKRLCAEHTAITGDGDKPIPLQQQVRQRLDQQFDGLEEYDYRLEPRAGWRFSPSSRTTHSLRHQIGNKAATGSKRSWDSWQTSSWTEL